MTGPGGSIGSFVCLTPTRRRSLRCATNRRTATENRPVASERSPSRPHPADPNSRSQSHPCRLRAASTTNQGASMIWLRSSITSLALAQAPPPRFQIDGTELPLLQRIVNTHRPRGSSRGGACTAGRLTSRPFVAWNAEQGCPFRWHGGVTTQSSLTINHSDAGGAAQLCFLWDESR